MRIFHAICVAVALLFNVAAFGQATKRTILVDWNNQGNGLCSTFTGTKITSFLDTAGSNWTSLKIRIPLSLEFRVNPSVSGGGHCGEKQWNDSTKWCTMHGAYDDFGTCQGICPEFYDGKVAFHYHDGDSEYLHVRRAVDPFPQD